MRLIDADALMWSMGCVDAVKYGNKTAEQQHNSYSTMMMYEIADCIECAPTIDAAPVVHARWGNDTDDGYTPCTNCGWKHPILDHNLNAVADAYCPSCGAKMDGGESDA